MDKLWTNKEIQDYYQVAKSTVYQWVKKGRLTPIKIAERTIRYSNDEVLAIGVQSQHETATSEGTIPDSDIHQPA